MYSDTKCIIDNWSLEHAAIVLDGSYDYFESPLISFSNHIGGLSNYINAILLYNSPNYINNGFEGDWKRFEWFSKNNIELLSLTQADQLGIQWKSSKSYADKGISNYLLTSKFSASDLFVSPERASEYTAIKREIINTALHETLIGVDRKIEVAQEKSWYQNIKVGVNDNFSLPSLTQYVLSLAKSPSEIFTILSQLKTDGKVQRVYDKLEEICINSKKSGQLQRELELIIDHEFGGTFKQENILSLTIPVYFLSITVPISLNFFNRKEHLIFLKSVIKSRVEANNLSDNIYRIFKRKLIE
ncbi:MAG TPA: hypothetical protein VJA82_03870 [Sediminibacterium sp.]|uniref:hypothetical protein n=1 Tax=Sediminibacterium sp. TaxID=1917865 RepID=UPI0008C07ADC|nr:hypothetical protein [Sediminibacterium sp.]OHC84739.1 MAG: hypothetical protein A2472_12080 [Sphingobacteriia bacterium RIFOXYC2_FULL_35_18]OHC89197.1 MAG: hypothetical protein A2546_00085 [Sphingobacteriia bacterium RIFOXYD2_FULL_35_12]HLD52416.1 hypothetical protein [Sediminibacterium sp.]